METRLIIAYAIMLGMALAVPGIAFHLWYNTHDRKIARRRLCEQRRYEERRLALAAAEEHGAS